jgi:CheY-like chemotaxis protein
MDYSTVEFPLVLSEFSRGQMSVVPYYITKKKTFFFVAALISEEFPVRKVLSQSFYDKSVTDKHIRSLASDSALSSRKAPVESRMESGVNSKKNDKLKRIMVVDDERDVTLLLKLILEGGNQDVSFAFAVDSFNDPLVALENYGRDSYDLVIIDVIMPKLNGFELYKELKTKDKNVKVCFLTAGEMYYERYRKSIFPELSTDKIIQKPVSNKELLRVISGYFEI